MRCIFLASIAYFTSYRFTLCPPSFFSFLVILSLYPLSISMLPSIDDAKSNTPDDYEIVIRF